MGVPLMTYWSISSIILIEEAEKLGLEVDIISKNKNLFYIKGNGKEILFKSTDFGGNSALGLKIADDKELTYKILERYNLPVAKTWYILPDEISNLESLNIVFPVIIKPLEEGHGNGVMMNILDLVELKEKLKQSFENYDKMIIQKQIEGDEYRVILLKGKIIRIYRRVPPSIIGDGVNTINNLISIENEENILRGEGYDSPLSYIKIDSELNNLIQKQGLSKNSIISKGKKIFVRGNSNIGTGGIAVDITEKIHPDIEKVCICSSNILNLELSGIDIITKDITRPLLETGGIILEINPTPGSGGRKTGKIILETLFLDK